MNAVTRERLFGFHHAFDSPITLWITVAIAAVLVIAALIVWVLHAAGKTSAALHDELVKRVISWAVMAPLLLGPVLLGAAWTILGVKILSVLCYREFARATGFFRQRPLSIIVVLGIIATTFASRSLVWIFRRHSSARDCFAVDGGNPSRDWGEWSQKRRCQSFRAT